MPVYFIGEEHLRGRTVSLTGPLHRHLTASLRVDAGDELWLALPSRRRYRARVTHCDRRGLSADILDDHPMPAPAHPAVDLAVAILKGDRMEWVVQKATELGVRALAPLLSARTIVRPRAGRAEAQGERWRRIALEAAQQSERWEIPQVAAPQSPQAYGEAEATPKVRLLLCERAEARPLAAVPLPEGPGESLALMIGPEGGWTEEELEQARRLGAAPVTLGERILRAETAAIAALAIVQSRLGNLG